MHTISKHQGSLVDRKSGITSQRPSNGVNATLAMFPLPLCAILAQTAGRVALTRTYMTTSSIVWVMEWSDHLADVRRRC